MAPYCASRPLKGAILSLRHYGGDWRAGFSVLLLGWSVSVGQMVLGRPRGENRPALVRRFRDPVRQGRTTSFRTCVTLAALPVCTRMAGGQLDDPFTEREYQVKDLSEW